MAKFLDTQAISHELMILIKRAKEKIVLVSPYLKVNPQIQERLKTRGAMGTLSEIVIVFGKSDLKSSEIEWMKGIMDLKVIEKANLHAKCYLSEDRAIICSMNLYDYSQQNNIEMGVLITRDSDKEAFDELIEEINNIKVNGVRKDVTTLESIKGQEQQNEFHGNELAQNNSTGEVNLLQQVRFEALKIWRLEKSREMRVKAYNILTDNEIKMIVAESYIDKDVLFRTIPRKKANQYSYDILGVIEDLERFTMGEVVNTYYQTDESGYDMVKLKLLNNDNKEVWYDTTQELPVKGKLVAVKLNKNWFNEYFYLD